MGNPSRQNFNLATTTLGPQQAKALDFLPLTSCTIAAAITDGTAMYSVEVTLDDIADPGAQAANWFTLEDFPVGTAVSKYGEIFTPWRFVRINIAEITGDLSFYVSQSLDASGSF